MQLIDSHAHIYLPEFDDDRQTLIDKSIENAVDLILMPAIDSSTHQQMLEVAKSYQGCLPMIGLHPCSVKEDFRKELELINQLIKNHSFIAIGEIGLDFYWDTTFRKDQYSAFEEQVQLSIDRGLPIAIHSRNATDECIEVISRFPGSKGVFHCFSGNVKQANKIIEMGFYLGIGGVVTFKNSGLDKILPEIGLQQIILETDAPYLAPAPFRGKRNEPSYIKLIAEKVASVLNLSLNEVASITSLNTKKLFSLK